MRFTIRTRQHKCLLLRQGYGGQATPESAVTGQPEFLRTHIQGSKVHLEAAQPRDLFKLYPGDQACQPGVWQAGIHPLQTAENKNGGP